LPTNAKRNKQKPKLKRQQNSFLLQGLGVALTNEVHMYSHTDDPNDIPTFVRLLQQYRVILSQSAHRTHHVGHLSHYCIFTGWLNEPLEKINFWRTAEKHISSITGWIPRGEGWFFFFVIDVLSF
jgi:hypothetical protein